MEFPFFDVFRDYNAGAIGGISMLRPGPGPLGMSSSR